MYEKEETSDIIGAYCTLLEDYQGICDGSPGNTLGLYCPVFLFYFFFEGLLFHSIGSGR